MGCGCNDSGDSGVVRIVGEPGADGDKGWSALLAVESDGDRRVLRISNWTGGEGTKPSTTNQYIGSTGIVETAALAIDIRGAQGLAGIGVDGTNGWSPILAVVADGVTREVLQIVDWTGGTGTKPSTTNQFLGALGIVTTAAAAVNIKGSTGATGAPGVDTSDGRSKITSNDTTLGYLLDKIAEGPGIHKTELNDGANETLQIGLPSFTGHGSKLVRVNSTATDVEYVTVDRQMASGGDSVTLRPNPSTGETIATLTTATGVNRNYIISVSTSIRRATTDPDIYLRIFVGGTMVTEFVQVTDGGGGKREIASILYLQSNVAAGVAIEFRLHTSDGNQVYLDKYTFIIDGTPA